jgi:translocation and assembly module TamA
LKQRFLDLSALQDARGEATNGAQIEARAREDQTLALRLLHSEGFYDAASTSNINPNPGPTAASASPSRSSPAPVTISARSSSPVPKGKRRSSHARR